MHGTVPTVSGALGSVVVGGIFLGGLALSFMLPFLAISAVRNLSRTRKALERIADALDRSGRGPGAGVLGL